MSAENTSVTPETVSAPDVSDSATPPSLNGDVVTTEPSMDSILAAAIKEADANPETALIVDEPKVEAKTGTEAPKVEGVPKTEEPKTETVAVARARSILAAANKKEQAAREREANVTATFASRLRTNPKALLAELGLDIDIVIDASIAEGKAPEAPKEPDRITALEKRFQDQQIAADQARLDTAIANTKATVAADSRFPTINAKGHQQLVVDFMIEYHQTHGKPIPWDRAAQMIEADLAPLPVSAPAKPINKPATTPTNRPGMTTLTNRDSRDYVQPEGTLPEDPDQLLKFLVAGIA